MPKTHVPRGIEKYLEHVKELNIESDRGAAILSVAFVDHILTDCILAHMKPEISSEKREGHSLVTLIFENNGPLSSFCSKIDIAYAFQILDETAFHDLHLVRRIRNEFAHYSGVIRFTDQDIAILCNKLRAPEVYADDEMPESSADPRERFLTALHFLTSTILSIEVTKLVRYKDSRTLKARSVERTG